MALPLLAMAKWFYRPQRLSPAALRRVADMAEVRGVSISRRSQVVLVLTEPKRKRSTLRGGQQ